MANILLSEHWRHPYWEVVGTWSRFKNGKPEYWIPHDITWLEQCERCERWGGRRLVQYRSQCRQSKPDPYGKPRYGVTYCMSCWNKVRRIDAQLDEADEIDKLLRKLKGAIASARKAQREALTVDATAIGERDQERPERPAEGPRGQDRDPGDGTGSVEDCGAAEQHHAHRA